MTRSSVSIIRCKTYEPGEPEAAVRRAVGLLGGMERFIKPDSRVLIKPNLLSARSPEEGVDTHPEIIRAVARIVRDITPRIFVGDSPGGWELRDIDKVYEKSGVKKVCSEEGLELVKFDKAVEIEGFPIASITREVDSIISVSKLKTHSTTVLTGAVKNTFGMVVGLHKAQCHLRAPMPDELSRLLVRVFGIVKPALSIMDGVVGMDGEGPAAGSLIHPGLILASRDAVSLDAVFAELAGIDPLSVPTTREASIKNKGIADLDKIDILGEKLEEVRIKRFKLPKASRIYNLPRPLIRGALRRVKFYPLINTKKCQRCGLCFNICPTKTIKKLKNGAFEVGIKNCIHCLCCYEVCPYKAISLRKSLLAKVLIR